jgi:chemotaxis signal transduction protein
MADETGSAEFSLERALEGLLGRAEDARRAAAARDAEVMEIRARELARPREEGDAVGDAHVVFTVGEERLVVPAPEVEEVVELPPLTPVPKAPSLVAGLFARRGAVYVGVDTAALLGFSGAPAYRQGVVLRAPDLKIALLVDEVTATRPVAPAEIAPVGFASRTFRGVTTAGEKALDVAGVWAELRRALGGTATA